LTHVTEAGFKPGRSLPPTWICVPPPPAATLGAVDEAGLAVLPPLEQATSADAQPSVPIAAVRSRFTPIPSVHAPPLWRRHAASTNRARCYRSQFCGSGPVGFVDAAR